MFNKVGDVRDLNCDHLCIAQRTPLFNRAIEMEYPRTCVNGILMYKNGQLLMADMVVIDWVTIAVKRTIADR